MPFRIKLGQIIKAYSSNGIEAMPYVKKKKTLNAIIGPTGSVPACGECELSYIGQTNNLTRRIYEHKYALRRGDMNSAIVKHVEKTGHSVCFNDLKTLAHSDDRYRRIIIEALYMESLKTMEGNKPDYKIKICATHST